MTVSTSPLLTFFDRVYCINLAARTDRRRQMSAEFRRIGVDPESIRWFKAVRPDNRGEFENVGARGCFLSHYHILQEADSQKTIRILILEDDADFVRDFNARLSHISKELSQKNWDVFYGGGEVGPASKVGEQLDEVAFDVPVRCTHFVGFARSAIERLPNYLAMQLSRKAGDPKGGPMEVDGSYSWARKELKLNTLIAKPAICYQRSSSSDIHTAGVKNFPIIRGLLNQVRLLRRKVERR